MTRTSEIQSSTLASLAYAQSLAERAEGIAKIANVLQRPSSAPGMMLYGKPPNTKENNFQDGRDSRCIEGCNIACGMYVDKEYEDNHDVFSTAPHLTTVMICNIPCRAKLEEIAKAVDSLGFAGTYDLLHAPGPKRRHARMTNTTNVGYAFINFLHPQHAQDFIDTFDGFCFEGRHSRKQGQAKFARVQGFRDNYMILKGGSAPCALPLGAPCDCAQVKTIR
jgi:hypothetical protein